MKIKFWGSFKDLENDPNYKCIEFENYTKEIRDSIIEELKEKGYRFSGYYHQYGKYGCPVFENNTYPLYTMRSWGDIIAEVNGDSDPMAYCLYAWNMDKEIIPKEIRNDK